ncbi:MAG TPA: glycosyltransferase family 4 protein [Bryobacteraceae bacterium]|jgi:glycosyltransferase involved in cell wall biosynthesis
MRILIVASFIPYPPDSGARIRTWEIARRFQREHEVTFGLHVRSQSDLARVEAIRRHGFQVIAGSVNRGWRALVTGLFEILSGGPPLFALRRSRDLEIELARAHAAEPFDVIQIEHFELARYGRFIGTTDGAVRSMILHDVLSLAYARMASIERNPFWRIWRRYNSNRLKIYERRLLPAYSICITVSDNDCAQITGFVEPKRIHVLPNGVDTTAKTLLVEPGPDVPAILFVGLFLYPPNADAARWMLEEIFPRVRALLPECSLYLVGGDAPRDLIKLSRSPGVFLTGRVDDVTPYYARCQVAVAPLRAGGGTRLKILEAMAFGRPVVSTTLGAEGLPVKDGEHLLLADTAGDFARSTVELLQDPLRRSRLRKNARIFVERGYRWEDCAAAHLRLYETLSANRRSLTPKESR